MSSPFFCGQHNSKLFILRLFHISVVVPNANRQLGEFVVLSVLQSYLRQAKVANALDLIRDEIDEMVKSSQDVSHSSVIYDISIIDD